MSAEGDRAIRAVRRLAEQRDAFRAIAGRTHREQFTDMLDSAGVPWRSADRATMFEYEADGNTHVPPPPDAALVVIEVGERPPGCETLDGYSAFYTFFEFDPAGALVKVEVWE